MVDLGKQLFLGGKEPKYYVYKIKTKLILYMEP